METYKYTPLNLDEPAFRLVRLFGGVGKELQCELIHAFLTPGSVMDYEAVSYTWGPVTHSILFIEVHGETVTKLPISYNLYHLLLDLRDPVKDRMLWIDAICINQDAQDATERNHQVQQMADIYRGAERVVVWLGRPTQEMDSAMVSLVELQSSYNKMEIQASKSWEGLPASSSLNCDNPRRRGIEQLFRRPWFRRIWILQEVGNARAALIYCGRKAVSSAIFSIAPSVFNIDIDSHCQAVLDLMPRSPARSEAIDQGRDLWTLLLYFRQAQATIEHDHIYALLGLCSEGGKGLRVSYEKPISTVISEVISHICPYEVTHTPVPLYSSIREFQADLDNLDEKVLKKLVTKGDVESLRPIFERQGLKFNMTESIMRAAAANEHRGKQLFDLIIQHIGELSITKEVVLAAMRNSDQGKEILGVILQRAERFVFTEKEVEVAIRKIGQNAEILNIILQRAEGLEITERMVTIALENHRLSKECLNIIFQRAQGLAITEGIILAAIRNKGQNTEFLDIILQRTEGSKITDGIVAEALRTNRQCKQCLDIIFGKAERLTITETTILAAAESEGLSKECIDIVLKRANIWAITGEVIVAAIRNRSQAEECLKTFVQHAEEAVINTKKVISAAISQEDKRRNCFGIISQRVGNLIVTESMVVSAICNTTQHEEAVRFILQKAEVSVINTERVISFAIYQKNKNRRYLDMISQRAGRLLVTEKVIMFAVCFDRQHPGDEITEYILQECRPITITRPVIHGIVIRLSGDTNYLHPEAVYWLTKELRRDEAPLVQFLLDRGLEIQFGYDDEQEILKVLDPSDWISGKRDTPKRRKTIAKLRKVMSKGQEQVSCLEFAPSNGFGFYSNVALEAILKLNIEYDVDCPLGAPGLWSYALACGKEDE
ncbi:heterokaryon incompatibility protein-domain-containing protein [Xylaria digitata]|nr:heterokaryon incompatibility protein-domain-containing protein [Xylaria digitata]